MQQIMLVTGGSRGIGAAVARLAGQNGYAVAVNYCKNETAARLVVEDIINKGGSAICVEADVGDEEAVNRMFHTVDEQLGTLDVLVNNAGILLERKPTLEMSASRLQRILTVNVIGSVVCAQEACRRMARSGGGTGGSIINLSSIAARLGGAGAIVDYALTKGAIETFTTGLALEMAGEGIRVNAVRPGLIDTDIHASGGRPDLVAEFGVTVPLGRAGKAEEVAEAILWLASGKASYCTGAIVDVAGGRGL